MIHFQWNSYPTHDERIDSYIGILSNECYEREEGDGVDENPGISAELTDGECVGRVEKISCGDLSYRISEVAVVQWSEGGYERGEENELHSLSLFFVEFGHTFLDKKWMMWL